MMDKKISDDILCNASGHERLAIAIVKRAAVDYRKDFERAARSGEKTSKQKRIERDLLSSWGDLITFNKGEYIVQQLQKELAEYMAQYNQERAVQ